MAITRYAGDRFTANTSDTKPTGVLDGAYLIDTGNLTQYVRRTSGGTSQWSQLAGGGGGGGTPGGTNTQVQFNNAGSFGGDADLTFTDGNRLNVNKLGISGNIYDSNNSIGNNGMVLTNEGTTGVNWKSIESVLSGVGGSGVANYVARWSDEDTITSGVIQDDGTAVGINQAADPDNALSIKSIANNSNPLQIAAHDGDSLLVFRQTAGDGRLSIKKDGGVETIRLDSDNVSYITGGNFGIGTANPSFLLHLQNASSPTIRVDNTVNNSRLDLRAEDSAVLIRSTSNFPMRFDVNQTERMRIDTAGNVGIGTTNPAYAVDIRKAAADIFVSSTTGTNRAGFQAANTGGTSYFYRDSSGGTGVFTGSTAYATTIGGTGAYSLHLGTNSTVKMTVTSAGNVGIGIAAPAQTLHIAKSAAGALGPVLMLDNTGGGAADSSALVFASGGDTYHRAKIVSTVESAATSYKGNLAFYTGRLDDGTLTEKVRIEGGGNVGIGTDSPAGKLHVEDSTSNTTATKIRVQGGSRGFTLGKAQTADNYAHLRPITDTANALRVMPNGTTAREAYVEVWNKDYETGANSTSWHRGMFYIDTSNDVYLRADGYGIAGSVFIGTENNTQTLTVKDSGNVGIGTNNPGSEVDIEGSHTNVDEGEPYGTGSTHINIKNTSDTDGNLAGVLFEGAVSAAYMGGMYMEMENHSSFHSKLHFATRNASSFGSKMVLTKEGFVGIGTVTPSYTLQANGTNGGIIAVTRTTANTTGTIGHFRFGADLANVKGIQDGAADSARLEFETQATGGSATTRLTIKSDGVVDINSAKLKINGGSGTDGQVLTTDGAGGIAWETAPGSGSVDGSGTANTIPRWTDSDTIGDSIITVPSNTSVQVAGPLTATGNITVGPSNNSKIYMGGNDYIAFTDGVGDGFKFVYDNTERLRITNTGKVGIGTTAPAYTLDVAGNMGVNQYIFHNGDADTFINFTDNDINFTAGDVNFIDLTKGGTSEITFNEAGVDVDVRMEGNTNANLFLLDASADSIGIGATPVSNASLYVAGSKTYPLRVQTTNAQYYFADSIIYANSTNGMYLVNQSSYLRFGANDAELMRLTGGSIGIGTTTPAQKLHVLGDAMRFERTDYAVALQLYNNNASPADDAALGYLQFLGKDNDGTANIVHSEVRGGVQSNTNTAVSGYLAFLTTNNATAVTEKMRIKADGKVGIGTTAPTQMLEVEGTSAAIRIHDTYSNVNQSLLLLGSDLHNTNTKDSWIKFFGGAATNDRTWSIGHNGNAMFRFNYLGTRATAPTGGTTILNLDGINNRVGIGTDTPATKLEIYTGNTRLSNDYYLEWGGTKARIGGSHTGDYVFFLTDNTDRMRIVSSGSVGIGTNNPQYLLEVYGDATLNSSGATTDVTLRWEAAGATKWRIKNDTQVAGGTAHTLNFTSAGAANVSINQAGNVGIGTNSAGYLLHVEGTGPDLFKLRATTAGSATAPKIHFEHSSGGTQTANIVFDQAGQNKLVLSTQYQSATDLNLIQFAPADNVAMTIRGGTGSSDGFIGIGTETPEAKLDLRSSDSVVAYFIRPSASPTVHIGSATSAGAQLGYVHASDYAFYGHDAAYNAIVVNSDGNVGIGTTNPGVKLDVNGKLSIGSANASFDLYNNGTTYLNGNVTIDALLSITGTTASQSIVNSSATDSAAADSYLNIFKTAGSGGGSRATLRVGYDAANCFQISRLRNNANIYINSRQSGSAMIFQIADVEKMELLSTGQLQLSTYGSGTYTGTLAKSLGVDSSGNIIEFTGGSGTVTGSGTTNYVPKFTSSTALGNSALYDGGGSNIGIGTNNPYYALDVRFTNNATSFSGGSSGNWGGSGLRLQNASATAGAMALIQFRTSTTEWFIGNKFISSSPDKSDFIFNHEDSEKVRFTNDGNVGIGITNPDNPLEVFGADSGIKISSASNNRPHLRLECGTAEKLRLSANTVYGAIGDSSDTNRYMVFKDGRVGINTATPGDKLHVYGGAAIFEDNGNNINVKNTWSSGNHDINFIGGSSVGGSATNTAARIRCLATAPGGAATGSLTFTVNSGDTFVDALYIKENGNIGVGITTPDNFVHIQESALSGRPASNANTSLTIEQATDTGIQFFSATQTQIRFGDAASTAAGAIIYAHGDDNFKLNFANGGHLTINDGSAEVVRVTSDNKVGIGTDNPDTKLHIVGDNGDQLKIDNDGDQWTQINFANNDSSKTFIALDYTNHIFVLGAQGGYSDLDYIAFRPDGTNDDMVIQRDGNVGIGTTSPTSVFHVSANSNTLAKFDGGNQNNWVAINSDNAKSAGIQYQNAGTAKWFVGHFNGNADGFSFYDASTSSVKLFIKEGGSVGIGTATPYRNTHIYQAPNSDNFEGALQVGGTGAAVGGYFGYNSTSSGRLSIISLNNAGGANAKIFLGFGLDGDGSPATEVMTLTQGGSVGIGTNSPLAQLDLHAGNMLIGDSYLDHHSINDNYGLQIKSIDATQVALELRCNGGSNATGTWRATLYGSSGYYGFLDGPWNNWDIRKQVDGPLQIDQGSGLETVLTSATAIVDGAGTAGKVTKWSDSDTVTDSSFLSESGTTLSNSAVTNNFYGTNAQLRLPDYGRIGVGTNSATSPFLSYLADNSTFSGDNALIRAFNGGNRGAKGHASGSNLFKLDFSDACAMIVNKDGNVGIGTTAPSRLLHVNGGSDYNARFTSASTRSGIVIDKPGTTSIMGSALVLADETFKLGTASYYHVIMYQGGATYLLHQGSTKIQTTATGVTVTGTLTETSSITLKENVETYTPSLDIINKIRPVKYNRKENKKKKEIGLIAEELAELFPELVERDEKGNPSSVNYSRAVTVLLGGFKELYKEVQELKKRI